MSQYTPPTQRDLGAQLLTTAGWVRGWFMVPARRSLTDYVNHQHDFFKLKDVALPGLEKRVPFFALQRRTVILIIPDIPEPSAKVVANANEKDVSCAFNGGVISGTLWVGTGVRVSDYLLQRDPFFPLTDCRMILRSGNSSQIRELELVLLNRGGILGTSEPRFV